MFKIIDYVDLDKIKQELKNKKVTAQFPLQGDDTAISDSYDLLTNESDHVEPIYTDMPYTNFILKKHKMYRSRVMKMIGGTCYTVHIDNSPRIHIPLISDDHNYFIVNDKLFKLPADGSVYLIDTRLPHTAINASNKKFIRTHIVGNVDDKMFDRKN